MKQILLVTPKYGLDPINTERKYWERVLKDFKEELNNQFWSMMFLTHERRHFGDVEKAGLIYSVLGKNNAYTALRDDDLELSHFLYGSIRAFNSDLSDGTKTRLKSSSFLSKLDEILLVRSWPYLFSEGCFPITCFEYFNASKEQSTKVLDALLQNPVEARGNNYSRSLSSSSLSLIVQFGKVSLLSALEQDLETRDFEEYFLDSSSIENIEKISSKTDLLSTNEKLLVPSLNYDKRLFIKP
ncbi:MAG: hypothetical protein WC758_03270 [Candidatus Woesearchaeota archaeon]|jgi:hypothetical protein